MSAPCSSTPNDILSGNADNNFGVTAQNVIPAQAGIL